MWRLLILALYLASIYSKCDEATQNLSRCILPPYPKHGSYEILEPEIPNLSPGVKIDNYTIQVSCDEGYHVTDSVVVLCVDGWTSADDIECLPYCRQIKEVIMSCGLGDQSQETKCLVPTRLDSEIGTRAQPQPMLKELDCGFPGYSYATVIAGGDIAMKNEIPWQAAIYTKLTKPYKQICGGSIVSNNVVISAAHCFWSDIEKQLPAANYAVAGGKLYRPWNEPRDEHAQKSDVVQIKIPARFQGDTTRLQEDIALVITAATFTFTSSVSPVCLDFDINLDNRQLSAGSLGKVAGWGLTGENSPESQVLKVVEMPVVDIQECFQNTDAAFRIHITGDKFCAGYQNGTSVCRGDSGGGLSFPEVIQGVKRYFLRGVVSASPSSQNQCNTLAWATFTQVMMHQAFIRETVPEEAMFDPSPDSHQLPLLQNASELDVQPEQIQK